MPLATAISGDVHAAVITEDSRAFRRVNATISTLILLLLWKILSRITMRVGISTSHAPHYFLVNLQLQLVDRHKRVLGETPDS
jgi:hypothetical protein